MKSNKTLNYFTNLHYVLQFFVVVVETLFEWFYRENLLLARNRVDFPSWLNTALLKMAIFFQLFPFHLLIHMYEVCVVFIYFRMSDSLLCKQVNQNIHFILWFIVHPFHFPMNICTYWNNFMQISFKRTSISPLGSYFTSLNRFHDNRTVSCLRWEKSQWHWNGRCFYANFIVKYFVVPVYKLKNA